MERLTVAGTTEVVIDRGLVPPLLPVRDDRRKAAVITQPAATRRASEIAAILESEGVTTEVIGVPDRDEAKTLEVAEAVYHAFARLGMGRGDTVVGVGGGAATDLAGFVAGTWMRGIEVVQFPTTLLAAVDASIGGKTGVNLAGKNLVGVIWHPTRVAIDIDLLDSLPQFLRREGMAEVLKAGLIGDPDLCRLVEDRGLEVPLGEVVTRAVSVKARIVDQDQRDLGVRALLNFGHTVGHAVEFASTLSHGESVALGMVAAAHISEDRYGFSGVERVTAAVASLGLPTMAEGLERARVADLLAHDKKRDADGLRMVLLRDIGDAVVDHVGPADLDIGLASIGV